MAFQIARLIAVVALLCAAAAIATPRGRLPLALRGLAKILKKDGLQSNDRTIEQPSIRVSPARRLLAFLLVLLAILLALI